jgi:hypothetical protein
MTTANSEINVNDYTVLAKDNCNKCYGRGYSGTNILTGQKVPCRCLKFVKKPEAPDSNVTVLGDESDQLPSSGV